MFAPKAVCVQAKAAAARPLRLPPSAPAVAVAARAGGPDQRTRDFSLVPVRARERAVHAVAKLGTSGPGEAIPYRAEIQRSFGSHEVDGVRVYLDSRAAAAARSIGARAYTIGERVAFAGAPDLHTAAHEAAHAVQQRAGLRPAGGVGETGDAYERHADAVADAVVGGRSAQPLLDRVGSGRPPAAGPDGTVVQRAAIATNFGEFDTTKYDAVGAAGSEVGVDIELTFDPDRTKVDAKKIGLTQTARSVLAGSAIVVEPARHERVVPSGTGEGREIDRTTMGAYANPLYAATAPGARDKLGTTSTVSGWGQHGWNYTDGSGTLQHQTAKLIDKPTLPGHGNNAAQTFETAALAVEGAQSGVYMGSVSWGWKVDGSGAFTKLPLTLVAKGNPSAEFQAAAKQWNKWTTAGTIKTTPDPTNVYDATYAVAFTVAKNTRVTVTGGSFIHTDVLYSPVRVESGPKTGSTGRIKVTDLRDTGGGKPSIDLPLKQQPKAGSEAAEVEKSLKVKDYSTAYSILGAQWMKPMLPTLSQLNKKGLLPDLYSNLSQAEAGVDVPRLKTAIEAVQYKENKTPLSKEFHDWIDPAKNARTDQIDEIKKFAGLP